MPLIYIALLAAILPNAKAQSFLPLSSPMVLAPRPGSDVDPNRNYLNWRFAPKIAAPPWTSRSETLLTQIESVVTLPPSTLRSFLLVAEGQVRQVVSAAPISSTPYQVDYSVSRDYFLPPGLANSRTNLRGLNESPQSMTVQLLVGDAGQTGISTLVDAYALASNRRLVQFNALILNSARTSPTHIRDFILEVLAANGEDRPILMIEGLDQLNDMAFKAVQLLLEQDSAKLVETSVILTTNSDRALPLSQTGSSLIVDIPTFTDRNRIPIGAMADKIDAIHVIHRPASPAYLETIIHRTLARGIANQQLGLVVTASEFSGPTVKTLVRDLAVAAFNYQENVLGRSVIRDLTDRILSRGSANPELNCDVNLGFESGVLAGGAGVGASGGRAVHDPGVQFSQALAKLRSYVIPK